MKLAMWGTLGLVMLAACVMAQDKAAGSRPDVAQTEASKPLTVSGKVSSDGKTLITDIDSEWMVSNTVALKGYEGRIVRVKCYVDSGRNRIQILAVKRDERDSNYTATRYADSAFRR